MIEQIVIKVGGPADADAVATLHADSRRTSYAAFLPPDALPDALGDGFAEQLWPLRLTVDYGEPANTPTLLLAESAVDGDLYGFAYLVPEPDGRVLLDNLHVRPGSTGGGIGTRLLSAALALARPAVLHLDVLAANTRAVAFYEREGGTRVAERDCVFADGSTLPEYEYAWAP
ncbi:N-acetyltransferase family protein [Kitasatospora sp. McL0602]|uniref:GNAT family N-acetyltransferase n=1 Tax=Kitasatospora sp. McL0602 TaxID=3439530 RepID=UPI003F89B252